MVRILCVNSKGGCGKSTGVAGLSSLIPGSEIVDLDPQGTLRSISSLTGKFKTIDPKDASGNFLIYDSPPYRSVDLGGIYDVADVIMIPVLLGYPDLLATAPLVELLRSKKMLAKATIVFCKVRKPENKESKELRRLFHKNFSHVNIAKQELSELKSFQSVLALGCLEGVAKEQMTSLAKELLGDLFPSD